MDALHRKGGAAHGCRELLPGGLGKRTPAQDTARQAVQQLPRPMLNCTKLKRAAAPASIVLGGGGSAQACMHAAGHRAQSMGC